MVGSRRLGALLAFVLAFVLLAGTAAHASPVVADAGGTAANPLQVTYSNLPPGQLAIIDGLPPDTRINIDATLGKPIPGGSFIVFPDGGEVATFQTEMLSMSLTGTGSLAGWHRDIAIPNVQCTTEIGPRTPGNPVQSFDTEMLGLQGQIVGDPDFDLLRITAGSGFGMPSPGHTTLTQLPGGNWAVDSFFDITYRIDFVGRPGGPLSGHSGSTTGTIRMSTIPDVPLPSTAGMGLALLSSLGLMRRKLVRN